MWCETQAVGGCCGYQFCRSRTVRFGDGIGRNTGAPIAIHKDLGAHMKGMMLGDATAALAVVAQLGFGT